jgi:hypothetical protein
MRCVLALVLVATLSTAARADQCAWVDEATAKAGAAVLTAGRRLIDYCEPCKGRNKKAPVAIKADATVRPAGKSGDYFEVVVDGKGVDLAYVFVEIDPKSKRFDNVAAKAGCPTRGVSESIDE